MPSTSFPAGTVTLGNNKTWARAGMRRFPVPFSCFTKRSSPSRQKSTLRIPSSVTKVFTLRSGNDTDEECSEI